MRARLRCILGAIVSLVLFTLSQSFAQGTAFTYQGRLNDGANPANGNYDFRFRLASDPLANNYVGGNVFTNALPISNGLFTATLDFGGVFNGSNYWLEVAVRTNGGSGYNTLNPLQPLTPAPYALFAAGASNVLGVVPSGGLSGSYSGAVSFNNAGNSFSGNGGGLTNVNAATLGGLGTDQFWKTSGNSNTVAGANFVGTADNQPLEVKANGTRALRIEPNTNGAPNLIGGGADNFVDPGIVGATIAGGGATNFYGFLPASITNHVGAIFGTIGGGRGNSVGADHGTIGGGIANTVESFAYDSVIGGGYGNVAQSNAFRTVIAGGSQNINAGSYSGIGGGQNNFIEVGADHSSIGGGQNNGIVGSVTLPGYGAIAGGYGNLMQTNNSYGFIGGGYGNVAQSNASYGTIGGGFQNTNTGNYATVPGGYLNLAGGPYSFAAGSMAQANHSGAFVWADASSFAGFASTAANQFSVRAAGGVRFVTGGAGMTLDGPFQGNLSASSIVSGTLADARLSANVPLLNASLNTFAGDLSLFGGASYHHLQLSGGNSIGYLYGSYPAFADGIHLGYNYYADASGVSHVFASDGATSRLTAGYGFVAIYVGGIGSVPTTTRLYADTGGVSVYGTFNNSSDRNAKQDFAPVSAPEILEKVAQLPLSEWSYKEDPKTRHVGPMGQDFYSLFKIGTDEKHIAPIDEGGVALAAIQGLNEKVEAGSERSEDRMRRLEAENAELKGRLERLERLIDSKDAAR